MAKFKLSELPAVTAVSSADALYIVHGTTSSQITVANLFANMKLANIPTYANNSMALSAGLTTSTVYKTSTGELRIVV